MAEKQMQYGKQGFNPYLPSWEYIPDGEPYVFGDRVYIYGSHDRFNGYAYCLNDYVCWSASVKNLKEWRYEGVIYRKNQDPRNADGDMCLYAPDVVRGFDGRYYLYYVLDLQPVVSVAVCDTPAGQYEFLGYVHYPDGTLLGERKGDLNQFDPGVLAEDGKVYLYTGFCPRNAEGVPASQVTVLEPDMLTVSEETRLLIPGAFVCQGTTFEKQPFFEASSIRKIGDTYYFVYSSTECTPLCYATSKSPVEGFVYRGVIVTNNDRYINTYKPAEKPMHYGVNNHGGIVEIEGQWYIFYHRHTNGTNFSRQACMEPICIMEDGSIPQVEMTSCGPNGGPLLGEGEYPAYIACNLFCDVEEGYTAPPGEWMDCRFPKLTQDGKDGDEIPGHIANMRDGATAGYKYFDCKGVQSVSVTVRGGRGEIELLTSWDGEVLGSIPVKKTNEWKEYREDISIPDGVQALYFRFRGAGSISFNGFTLHKEKKSLQ